MFTEACVDQTLPFVFCFCSMIDSWHRPRARIALILVYDKQTVICLGRNYLSTESRLSCLLFVPLSHVPHDTGSCPVQPQPQWSTSIEAVTARRNICRGVSLSSFLGSGENFAALLSPFISPLIQLQLPGCILARSI